MLLTICAILPMFYGALAGPLADQYFDNVLGHTLPPQLRAFNLDPARLSDFYTEFQDKVAIIGKVKGRANFTDGQLTGLLQVQRFSPCGGPAYKFGQAFVNCTVAFHNLQVSYGGKMKYGKMPVVPVKGKANVTTTTVFIEVTQSSPNQPGSVSNIYFQQLGGVDPKFTGLGKPLNKFLTVLAEGYKTHVNAQVLNVLAQQFKNALGIAAAQVPFPR